MGSEMTIEEIIKLAREAGATPYTNRHYPDRPTHTFNVEQLERLVALVAAAEREKFVAFLRQMHDAYALASDPPRSKT